MLNASEPMPNSKSIISTVASEFSIYLGDCQQQEYDFNIEVATMGEGATTAVRLRLRGDGLAVWVNNDLCDLATQDTLEGEIYRAVRDLPVVKQTIKAINARADRQGYDADI